jgi:acyl-CoA synthetase (AMP-forming)/AMP-acid ligase II
MTNVHAPIDPLAAERLNVADRLAAAAAARPSAIAVACPRRLSPGYRIEHRGDSGTAYATISFAELDQDATRLAHGLVDWGVAPGARLALLVRPGIEFVTLVFALLRAGAVTILIDPGMGRQNLIRSLAEAEPEGFVAISAAQAARLLHRRQFPRARWNVTVGRRWFWGGVTLGQLRRRVARLPAPCPPLPATYSSDPAAIIFTSGSTGPAKGVLYTQRMFDTQVAEIQSTYQIEPGGADLACFPLFALFNSAMGVTTVLPDMDFSRPATADPHKLLAAANDWQVTQAFASPAVWRVLGDHCARTGERIDSLRKVFSCGAPVPAEVLRRTLALVGPAAEMHTPYGATECLPVSTIEAAEVLGETSQQTSQGAGVCVGRKFDSIEWRVIRITDEPIATIDQAEELPAGEIGELVVRGPQASPAYVTRTEANAGSKIADIGSQRAGWSSTPAGVEDDPARDSAIRDPQSAILFHRMGDVGYLDAEGRFWYCGRKSQRVETAGGTLFTECVEAVLNTHPDVARTALVGLGPRGRQIPVVVVEPTADLVARHGRDWSGAAYHRLLDELRELASRHPCTESIDQFLLHAGLPVDVRHNAKINREQLAAWAAQQYTSFPRSAWERKT